MPYRLLAKPIINSFIDNVIRDTVVPEVGSILYCDLAVMVEHTGVYIGNNEIVHLDGSGAIEVVTPQKFLSRLNGVNSLASMSIYVSCNGVNPVGKQEIAENAKSMVGKRRDYSLLSDNCHQFSAGCIYGDFDNSINFFNMLKQYLSENLLVDNWRVWKRKGWNIQNVVKDIDSIENICHGSQTKLYSDPKPTQEIDKQFIELASILVHYILDRKVILPVDILYFEKLLQDEFQVYDNSLLKELFSLRKELDKHDVEELFITCFSYMPLDDFEKMIDFLEGITEDENYNRFRDINLLFYDLKQENNVRPDVS